MNPGRAGYDDGHGDIRRKVRCSRRSPSPVFRRRSPPARLAYAIESSSGTPAPQHGGDGCDHGVAGTRNIIHFTRIGQRVDHFVRSEKRHAFFGARQQQGVEIERFTQLRHPREQVFLGLPVPDHLTQFRAIRRDQRGPPVTLPVVAFGIHEHRFPGVPGFRDHLRDVRQAALRVVRHQDHVVFRQQGVEAREAGAQDLVRRRILKVDPQQLLLPRQHPQLDGGEQFGVRVRETPRPCSPPAIRRCARRARRARPRTGGPPGRRAAALRATLAAPPSRSSLRCTCTTGTGASGEMRFTSPNQ